MDATHAVREARGTGKGRSAGDALSRPAYPGLLPPDFRLVTGNAGDHCSVAELLHTAGHAVSQQELHASLDDPYYEPSDRLLIRLGRRAVAHLQLTRRTVHLGRLEVPAAGIHSLCSLPEYRYARLGRRLLEEAEYRLRRDGVMLALVRTGRPEAFARHGWLPCGTHVSLQINPRTMRAYLSQQPWSGDRHERRLSLRLMRHVELRQLLELYNLAVAGGFGPLDRSEEFWRWLVSRGAYSQLLVAIEGKDTLEFGRHAPNLVGYAVVRNEHLVELVAENHNRLVTAHLLARACRDAIERDESRLLIHVPRSDESLGNLVTAAGGVPAEATGIYGQQAMIKLLDPVGLVERSYPELHARAKAGELRRPCELNLSIDGTAYRLSLSRRSVRMDPAEPQRTDVTCSSSQFARLVLGTDSPVELLDNGEYDRIVTRTKTIRRRLETLFPPLRWWRPLFDDLPA